MTVGQIFRDFSGWTSAHGIPHIGSAQNACLRVFWTIIFTVSCGMFTWQMVLLIQKYLQYDVTVQTELKFEERPFPAVTVCNLNPYILDAIETDPQYTDMKATLDEYERVLNKSTFTSDKLFVTSATEATLLNDSIAIQSRARDVLMYQLYGKSGLKDLNLFYKKEDFVINCAYNTKPCNIQNDFEQLIDPIYGACYQFNNKNPPTYNSTRAGPLYGLRVLLKSNQSQYINLTESAGVRVAIHGQGEPPFPDAFGYNAAAGFTTSFGIQFIRTKRLPYPYGNCTTDFPSNIPYFYSKTTQYSTEACFRSCLQQQVVNSQKCSDPRFNKDDASTYCTVANNDIGPMLKVLDFTGSGTASADGGKAGANVQDCTCQQPCDESTYGVTVSTALWPSEVYTPPECKNDNQTIQKECQKWYGENTMLVEVYYERMNYQMLSEQEAYLLVNLISDMGGQLGLWMGFSVITMIEFLALFILLIIYCCSKHKKAGSDQVHPFTNEQEKDMNKFDSSPNHPPPPYTENEGMHQAETSLNDGAHHVENGAAETVARNRPVSTRSLAK